MKTTISAILGSALLATGAVATLAAAPAQAALSSCTSIMTDRVVGEIGCQVSSEDQDNVGNNAPLTVNTEGFFNFTDWAFSGKLGVSGYSGDGTGQSGNWNLSNVIDNTWTDIMLVFKSGQEDLIGYRFAPTTTSGTWQSPFLMQNGNYRDVSHVSVYYRAGVVRPPVDVPEPATLLGLGVVGAGLFAGRKGKKA